MKLFSVIYSTILNLLSDANVGMRKCSFAECKRRTEKVQDREGMDQYIGVVGCLIGMNRRYGRLVVLVGKTYIFQGSDRSLKISEIAPKIWML